MSSQESLAERKRLALAKAAAMVRTNASGSTKQEVPAAASEQPALSVEEGNPKIKPSSYGLRPLFRGVRISAEEWLLTMDPNSLERLENPPSLADGIEKETEEDLRYLGCELIQAGSILLKLPQTAAATGQIIFQRFYYQRSFLRYNFEYSVMACLLLASKIEEAPRKPRDVLNVFWRLEQLHRLKRSGAQLTKELTEKLAPRLPDARYANEKNQVIKAERRILSTLGFVVHVRHPHKLIISYIHGLGQLDRTDFIQKAWCYMNDGLRTDIFLRYRPETVACACIHLAARTVEPPVSLPKEPLQWFELFDACDRDVQHIGLVLLKLYARKRAPNWDRLNHQLEKLREEKGLIPPPPVKKAEEIAAKMVQSEVDKKKNGEERDENRERRRERDRDRDRDRRSPDKRHRSPHRRRERSNERNGRHRSKGERRHRERDRDYDKDKERSRLREKEVQQSLGKRYRRESPEMAPKLKR